FHADVLLAVSLPSGKIGNTKATEALVPVIGTAYGMLMKQRYHELSAVQKMVSIVLANEQTHQKVVFFNVSVLTFQFLMEILLFSGLYDRLQPIGVSLSHQGMLGAMSAISGSFNEELINAIKDGKKFRILGDNVNFHMGVDQARKSIRKVGHMQHWFGSAAILQNIFNMNNPSMTFGKSPHLASF
ncbi:hypothetical protein MAR_026739, partial [Mya arenaria]